MIKRIVKIFLSVALVINAISISAEELRPRGSLGVMGDPQPNDAGVVIQQVAPNSSASEMGILPEDRITQLNGKKVRSFADLIGVLNMLRAGDKLEATVNRKDKTHHLSGVLKAAPKDSSNEFNVIYSSVVVGKDRLRSIIYTPKAMDDNKQYPALYFVQGYTCDSVGWGRAPELTIRQALTQVVKSGYVVYRIEKFGVGDSEGPTNCSQVDFTKELSGFNAGMAALKSLDYVDESKVHIFGHSLGGLYAPLMALESDVASVIAYGSVVKPWYDYLLDIYSEQALIFGTSKSDAEANKKRMQPFLHALLKSQRSLEDIRADKSLASALASEGAQINGEQFFGRHYSFFRDLNQYNFYDIWAKIEVPTLAIHGEFDIQAINDNWTEDIIISVNQKGKKFAERVILEKTDHSILKYSSMPKLLEAMRDRTHNAGQPGEHYNAKIEQVLIEWLNKNS